MSFVELCGAEARAAALARQLVIATRNSVKDAGIEKKTTESDEAAGKKKSAAELATEAQAQQERFEAEEAAVSAAVEQIVVKKSDSDTIDVEATLQRVAAECGSLFASADRADATQLDGFFLVWVSTLQAAARENGAAATAGRALMAKLIASVAALPQSGSGGSREVAEELRAGVLNSLYSVVDEEVRPQIYSALVDVVVRSKQLERAVALAREFPQVAASWGSETAGQITELRHKFCDFLVAQHRPEVAEALTIAFLRENKADSDAARFAVGQAVRDPAVLVFDQLASLAGVKVLEKEDAPVAALLGVFSSGTFSDFKTLVGKHTDLLSRLHIDPEEAERKIRVLTLASLASKTGNARTLSFADIASALAISEADVELWAIEGVGARAWSIKLDPASSSVRVESFVRRSFGSEDWKDTSARLAQWEGSLTKVLAVLNADGSIKHPEKLLPLVGARSY